MRAEIFRALEKHLDKQVFVTLGTADRKARPHNSPKVICEFKDRILYLVEDHKGSSYANILENPHVSVSTFNLEQMTGFHIYGKARIIAEGNLWKDLLKKCVGRQIDYCTQEVIERVKGKEGLALKKFICCQPIAFYKIRVAKVRRAREHTF